MLLNIVNWLGLGCGVEPLFSKAWWLDFQQRLRKGNVIITFCCLVILPHPEIAIFLTSIWITIIFNIKLNCHSGYFVFPGHSPSSTQCQKVNHHYEMRLKLQNQALPRITIYVSESKRFSPHKEPWLSSCHWEGNRTTGKYMTTQIWSRFPTLAGFLKRIIVLHRVGDRCQRSCFLVGSIFSWAGTMNRLWDLYEFSDFLAPLVLSDLQVKLVPVMPCALCTPQILYRLSRSSYSNLNDPDPLPPQRFCIVSHSTYSNLKRLPAWEIASLSSVQKIHQLSAKI